MRRLNIKRLNIKEVLEYPEYNFLKTHERLGNQIDLLCFGGSHASGLESETSDIDLRGILSPLKRDFHASDYLRHPNDKNDPNLIITANGFEQYKHIKTDTLMYERSKFIRLAYDSNPNALDILGCRREDYAIITSIGQLLLDNTNLFLTKLAYEAYEGYARGQFIRLKSALILDSASLAEKQIHIIEVIERMNAHLKKSYPTFQEGMIEFYLTDAENKILKYNENSMAFSDITFYYTDGDVAYHKNGEHILDLNGTKLKLKINTGEHLVDYNDLKGIYSEIKSVIDNFGLTIGHRNNKKTIPSLNKHIRCLRKLYYSASDIFEKKQIITYVSDPSIKEELMDLSKGSALEDRKLKKSFLELLDNENKRLFHLYQISDLPESPDILKIFELQNKCMELQKGGF